MNCLFLYVICNHFSQNDSSLNVQLSVIEFVYLCHDCHSNKFANPRNILWSFDEYSFDPPRPGPVTENPSFSLFLPPASYLQTLASPSEVFSTRPEGLSAKVLLHPQECCWLGAGRKGRPMCSLPPALCRKRGGFWMVALEGAQGQASSGCFVAQLSRKQLPGIDPAR